MADVVQEFKAPSRLYPLRKHPEQTRLMKSLARFKLVPAGRRSGKTERAKRFLVRSCIMAHRYPDENYFAAAPTRDQAKSIYWEDLKRMTPRELLRDEPRETDLSIPFITGATLYVIGMDKPQRIEGKPWDGGVLDEYANMKPGAWGENVRPALSDRLGWAWLIGVPEGRNHYYDLVQKALAAKQDGGTEWDVFTWPSSDILPASEVESARRDLDPLVFAQEYEASFINFVGRAYYRFNQEVNCSSLKWNKKAPLIFCFDFNVDPGIACVVQEQRLPGAYHRDAAGVLDLSRPIVGTGVIGEVWIPQNSNTPAVVAKLIADWGDHQGEVFCYGDATGGSRGTAQTEGSDWDLIKRDLRAHFGGRVHFKVDKGNPAERARVNAMNARCCNGADEVFLMVDRAHAPHVVKDLDGVRVLEGGSGELDKKHDLQLTHISDALGYYVAKEFPVIRKTASVSPLRA